MDAVTNIVIKKRCSRCKIVKPLDCFTKHKQGRGGIDNRCRECKREVWQEYINKKDNRETRNARQRVYNALHPLTREQKDKKNKREKRYAENDIKFRLSRRMRAAIYLSLKGNKEHRRWEDIVGYSLSDLIKHLEKQFVEGMSWDNHGEWHIDHIIPISKHNFSNYRDIDFKKCWDLKNLRPLWARENMVKHNRLDRSFQPGLSFYEGAV